jgi:threonine dehydrogenase-like Zn-dependent dehydrogenase
MKAAVLRRFGHLEIEDVPDVPIGDYDAKVQILACGLCNGTDHKLYQGEFPPWGEPPSILGHESVGRVIAVGSKVRNYHIGDMVYRAMARYDLPGSQPELGFGWGGFAEFGKVTDGKALLEDNPGTQPDYWWGQQRVFPEDIPFDDAIMLITMMETWSWLAQLEITSGSRVLILGLGPVGLAMAVCCRLMGAAQIIGVARTPETIERARAFGVMDGTLGDEHFEASISKLTGGKGVDRVVDAVGSRSLVARCESVVSDGGRIGIYGIEPAKRGMAPVPFTLLGTHPCSLHFINPDEPGAQSVILGHYRAGRIPARQFITHRLPLEQINRAMDMVHNRQALKVIIITNTER